MKMKRKSPNKGSSLLIQKEKNMNRTALSTLAKNMKLAAKKHSAQILTGIGIAGMLTTTVLAIRATPKALILIEKCTQERESVTPLEKVRAVWKCYIPTVITGGMSILCLVGASSVNTRRNTALATAYTLSESALKEYQEKVIETIGERKEGAVRDAIAKDKIDRDPVGKHEVIITSKGNTLCYDAVSGRYFRSDIDRLKKAENELNRQMRDEMYISLNEYYCEIGLSPVSIGSELGWNIERGYIDLHFSSQLAEDGTPCLVVEYHVAPQYGYQAL